MKALALALFLAIPASAVALEPPTELIELAQGEPASAALALEAHLDKARRTDRGWVHLYAGEARRLAGDAPAARAHFDAVSRTKPPQGVLDAARLGLALLAAEAVGAADEVISTLREVSGGAVLASQDADRRAWLAIDAASTDPDQARALGAAALELSVARPAQHARIEARLAALDRAQLVGTDALAQAADALAKGDRDAARRLADAMDGDADEATRHRVERLRRVAAGAPRVPGRIGLLVPLSGRFAAVGRQVEEAVRTGWERAGVPDQLVVADSGGTAETAVAALERLAADEGVVGVLGPLLSDETDAVVSAASGLGLPLVSMSQALDDAHEHPWVFQAWITPADQVRSLVDHAVDDRGWTTFAVLAPDTPYGQHAAELFETHAAERGAEVVIRDVYPPDATDFRPVAQRLARRPSADTPPVVDYQAIFVPDHARRVALVAAGLAFEEIPVGNFQPHGPPSVKLLGLSGWNRYELLAGGGIYTVGALFTDVFVPPPAAAYTWYADEPWKGFVADYRERFDRTPTPVEALAHDAGQIVATAAASRPATPAALRDALLAVSLEGTVTGATAFDPGTRSLTRPIRVVSVRKDGFDPVDED